MKRPPIALSVKIERWPIAGRFAISRGAKTEAAVIVATLSDGKFSGRGECVPYARYGESVKGVLATIASMTPNFKDGMTRGELQEALPPGAARNALDCALWELSSKRSGKRAWELADLSEPSPVVTAYTISLDTPVNGHQRRMMDDLPVFLGQPRRHNHVHYTVLVFEQKKNCPFCGLRPLADDHEPSQCHRFAVPAGAELSGIQHPHLPTPLMPLLHGMAGDTQP